MLADVDAAGAMATAVSTDVADAGSLEAAAEAVEHQLGPIDVWVNNAMTSVFGLFTEVPLEDVRRVTEVTYLGYVHGTRAALNLMLPRDRGLIVQVGSALAFRGIPLQSAYCAAKHAIRGFDASLRAELLHERSRVRICEVHLPAVNTPQFRWVRSFLDREAQPVPPIYQPELQAEAIAWVLDHPRRSMWIGPSTVAAVVASAIAPSLIDRYLALTGYRSQQTPRRVIPHGRTACTAPSRGTSARTAPSTIAHMTGRFSRGCRSTARVCPQPRPWRRWRWPSARGGRRRRVMDWAGWAVFGIAATVTRVPEVVDSLSSRQSLDRAPLV
jgi:NAD(P)-dependent dehydrogenase (short-subunit alcohol dehydrogenase family)